MMSAMQRRKGAEAEREVVAICKHAGIDAKRTAPMQARGGGEDADVAISIPGYHLEIKRCERLRLDEWSRRVEADASPLDAPCIVYRRSREPWRVSLELDEFLLLVRRASL